MSPPALLAVAHGSRDPRSAATVARLLRRVRALAPELTVRGAFLDLNTPSVPDALADLHAAGQRDVTVVPLLLGSAYHARVDLPELTARASARLPGLSVTTADVLGADPRLLDLAVTRVAESTEGDGQRRAAAPKAKARGVVVAGVGSSSPEANATVAGIAARWRSAGAATHAFATCEPSVAKAIDAVRSQGADDVVIAPWFLALGLLLDRITADANAHGAHVAAPLGADPVVAEVVLSRYFAVSLALVA